MNIFFIIAAIVAIVSDLLNIAGAIVRLYRKRKEKSAPADQDKAD